MQGNVNGQVVSALLFALIIVGWTASYLLRVFTGRMAFNAQVELFKDAQLQTYLDQLSPEELAALVVELAADAATEVAITTSQDPACEAERGAEFTPDC